MWSHLFCNCTTCTHLSHSGTRDLNHTASNFFNGFTVSNLDLPFDCAFCCNWTAWGVFTSIFLTAISLLTAVAIYYVLYVPLNIMKDLSEVGSNHLKDGTYSDVRNRKRSKRELVREAQRQRKLGDMPPVYPNGWFALIESQDLKKGEVRNVVALGENFAVFRSQEGKANVLDAYCPHLGANMAIGGVVRGDCLECPFHNWRFDGATGSCTSVPYSDKAPEFVKAKTWLSVEENDFVFVWYHAEGEEPTWYPENRLTEKEWRYHGRTEFLVGCHIQDIPENGADIAHLNAIHRPNVLAGDDLRLYERPKWKFLHHRWKAQWQASEEETHKGLVDLSMETRLWDKIPLGGRLDVHGTQIGPAYVVLDMQASWGPMLILQTVTPVEPMVQRVVHRIYSPPALWQGLTAKVTLYMEAIMFGRDVMVWNYKTYVSRPQLVKEDRTIVKHRRWYNQFYSENSPKFTFRKDTLEW